ncbi:hypothetical protein V5O48_016244 [Marasmius crinis-equi]|uniref:DUF1772-domain-containing protein n=1 Tax=Marasmius crinis-equi TaxID=585013 RepID=A0ABR3ESB8_9AGAR
MPTLAAIASSAYFYLAYRFSEYSHSLTRKYVVAGLLTLGILPYARLVMAGTNDELIDKAVSVPTERKNVADEGAVRELIERWSTMNLVRGLLPLTGTLMALNATFF